MEPWKKKKLITQNLNEKTCHNCGSHNNYADNCPIDREEIFPIEEETRKGREGLSSDSASVRSGCGDDSYSELNPILRYLVYFEDHDRIESAPFHSARRKLLIKQLDGVKHKTTDRESMSTRKLEQGGIDHTRCSPSHRGGKSHQ
ncbi:hypothetical protein O181_101265 [Austropuccinia psidii MF-1]|uniref:Uncharacterized protein n=1 Tax=Austropuccinia psidii MF-1 TaxID=1389203 RepID=A0A9Q3JH82_9BASI|nr:hypothetical protein [Austropuccinia psidii MF-1]